LVGRKAMSKETLKVMRLIVPGILIFLLFYPLHKGALSIEALSSIHTEDVIYVVIVLVLGGIYKTLELRSILFKEQLDLVHQNIKSKLLAPFSTDSWIAKLQPLPAKSFLKVFYKIVDSKSSTT
jgi:hypothetical protein